MNKKNIFLISILAVLFLFSCEDSLFMELSINNVPPIITSPTVKSFEIEGEIIIEWEKDFGADEYVLYRSETPLGVYSEIYRGNELSYIDNVSSYEFGKFFYYKLAKKREIKEFPKSNYQCGVYAKITADNNEDNDTQKKAFDFTNLVSLSGNIQYYADGYGNELVDTEWFILSVPPNMYADIRINFENGGDSNDLKMYSAYCDTGIENLYDQATFSLSNRTTIQEYLPFQIFVDKNNIIGVVDSGYNVIIYTLHLTGMAAIQPQN